MATGLANIRCAICGHESDSQMHRVGLADVIGADATQCPGCDQIWPIEMTVRMMRFVRKDGTVLEKRHMRVCHECAGMPVDRWKMLALRRDRGWISEDDYVDLVAKLASETEERGSEAPLPCGTRTRYGLCNQIAGHPGSHTYQAIKAQIR